ncbi:MAG: hypothetical protein WC004_03455 [Candidatus Absconditabacterales bacterium]
MTVTRRNIYHTLSLIKLIIGLVVLVIVYQYIDPFQDPETGVIIGSIGLLFLLWGTSYFVFYFAGLRRSDHKIQLIASHAYKLSLLVALFFLTNIVFLVVEFWTALHSFVTLIIFGAIYWFIFHKPLPEQHTSIDFLSQHKDIAQDDEQEGDVYRDLIDKNKE